MKAYRIKDWERHFEIAQSKRANRPNRVSWVATPNKHDGKSFKRLLRMKDGMALYGAWQLIVQVASKCPVRGLLADEDGPLCAETLSLKTEGSAKVFERALEVLSSQFIGWLEVVDSACHGQPLVDHGPDTNTQTDKQDRQNDTVQDKTDAAVVAVVSPKDFQEAWNALGKPFPRIIEWTDKRSKALRVRCSEPFFVANWRAALARIRVSEFCRGGSKSRWIADADFFLKPDTVTKALEGKYDNPAQHHGTSSTVSKGKDAGEVLSSLNKQADERSRRIAEQIRRGETPTI